MRLRAALCSLSASTLRSSWYELQRPRHVRLLGHGTRECDRILHGELGARADGEVRRMGSVADEHDVAVMPLAAQHAIEIEPRRPTQVARIAHERVPIEILGKHPLAEGNGGGLVRPSSPAARQVSSRVSTMNVLVSASKR